jgi:uncharacterized protein YjbJ (UPF0337 family)
MAYPQNTSKSLFRLYVGNLAIAISAIAASILVWANPLMFVDTGARAETISSLPFVVAVQGVTDQIQGKVEKEAGRAQRTLGKATGQTEGALKQAKGEAKQNIGKAKSKVDEAGDKAKKGDKGLVNSIKDFFN